MIEFVKDVDSWFAIETNEVYNGVVAEELLYCEILRFGPQWQIRWEDDYNNPEKALTLEDAREHIRKVYTKHKPYINGKTWEIEE